MFMTTAPARTAQPNGTNPPTDRSGANAAPSRSAHLRGLVQILIAFGKSLLETLQAPLEPQTRFNITCRFGTRDIALIIARITRGLLLAQALDDRLFQTAPQLDRPRPAAIKAPSRNPQPMPPKPEQTALPARLPTAEEIAIQVRRQPIGRVIEDICRDLGINPSHEFWHQLQLAIIDNGGNLARLFKAMLTRISLADLDLSPAMPTPQPSPQPARTGTGPP
jgi:hypothetical protein